MADFKWNVSNGVIVIRSTDDRLLREYDTTDYPAEIRSEIYDFGCKSGYQARASQVPQADKLAYWDSLHELWLSGKWEFDRKAGPATVPAWIEALANVKGCTIGAIQKTLGELTKDERADIRKNFEAKHAAEIQEVVDSREAPIDLDEFAATDEE